MGKYLLKRLGQSIIAILGITVVVFFILHLTGNPVELMVSPHHLQRGNGDPQ